MEGGSIGKTGVEMIGVRGGGEVVLGVEDRDEVDRGIIF